MYNYVLLWIDIYLIWILLIYIEAMFQNKFPFEYNKVYLIFQCFMSNWIILWLMLLTKSRITRYARRITASEHFDVVFGGLSVIICFCFVDRFYIALFSALEQTHCARMWFYMSEQQYSAFLNIHRSGVLTALAWLVPHETAAISARSVYTMQPCTMSLHAKPHT